MRIILKVIAEWIELNDTFPANISFEIHRGKK